MRVLLFRHGAVQRSGGKAFIGRTDLPLSPEGRRQAAAWRRFLGGRPPGRIVSSPLSRALEFARVLGGEGAGAVSVCPELSEIDLGAWDGRLMQSVREADPASWRARGEDMARFRPPGGESFADVQQRAVAALDRLVSEADAGDLIVVAHAGVNRAILCRQLGMPLAGLFRIGQDPACLNVIDFGPNGARVLRVNQPCPDGCGAGAAALFSPFD